MSRGRFINRSDARAREPSVSLMTGISSFVFCLLALGIVRRFFGGLRHRLKAATPSSTLFVEAEVTLCFFSHAALRWALVISPREPLALKDDDDFNMVHGSFYDVCVFGWWEVMVTYMSHDIGLVPTVERHSQSAGEYLLVCILQDEVWA